MQIPEENDLYVFATQGHLQHHVDSCESHLNTNGSSREKHPDTFDLFYMDNFSLLRHPRHTAEYSSGRPQVLECFNSVFVEDKLIKQ